MNIKNLNKVLILASIFCAAEASFRSMEEHEESFKTAAGHLAKGAAVIVLAKAGNDFRSSNGVYIGRGQVLTHAHESREEGAWVISPHMGGQLVYKVSWEKPPRGSIVLTNVSFDLDKTLGRFRNACREVKSQHTSKAGASADSRADSSSEGDVFSLDSTIERALANPIGTLGSGGTFLYGSDICVLDLDKPFDDVHPIAKMRDVALPSKDFEVSVLGYSLATHLYDGTRLQAFADILKRSITLRNGKGVHYASIPIKFTSFRQLVAKESQHCLFVEAAWNRDAAYALHASHDAVSPDELFDPTSTDERTQALAVDGLSGSGIFDETGALVGIVSNAFVDETRYLLGVDECKKAIENLKTQDATFKIFQGRLVEANEKLAAAQAKLARFDGAELGETEQAQQYEKLDEDLKKHDDNCKKLQEIVERLEATEKLLTRQVYLLRLYLDRPISLLNIHQRVTRADIDRALCASVHHASGGGAAAAATGCGGGGGGGSAAG